MQYQPDTQVENSEAVGLPVGEIAIDAILTVAEGPAKHVRRLWTWDDSGTSAVFHWVDVSIAEDA
jgi:hypothetical protein